MPQTTTSCPVLHNHLAPSDGKINQDRSDMIQPFTSIILHKTTDHSSTSSTHRRRLTRASPASRMPLANFCKKSGPLQEAWLKTCSWRMSWFVMQPLHVTHSQDRSLQLCSSAPPAHLHNMCCRDQQKKENSGQGDWDWGDRANMGCILTARPALGWSTLRFGSAFTSEGYTASHFFSFSEVPLPLSAIAHTPKMTFLHLQTQPEHQGRNSSPTLKQPNHSYTLQTLTSALPEQHCLQESSTDTAGVQRAHWTAITVYLTPKQPKRHHPTILAVFLRGNVCLPQAAFCLHAFGAT